MDMRAQFAAAADGNDEALLIVEGHVLALLRALAEVLPHCRLPGLDIERVLQNLAQAVSLRVARGKFKYLGDPPLIRYLHRSLNRRLRNFKALEELPENLAADEAEVDALIAAEDAIRIQETAGCIRALAYDIHPLFHDAIVAVYALPKYRGALAAVYISDAKFQRHRTTLTRFSAWYYRCFTKLMRRYWRIR